MVYKDVQVHICDSANAQFVTRADIMRVVNSADSLKPKGKLQAALWCEGAIQVAFPLGEDLDEEKVQAKFLEMLNDLREANRLAKEGNIAALMELWGRRRQLMPASSEEWL